MKVRKYKNNLEKIKNSNGNNEIEANNNNFEK